MRYSALAGALLLSACSGGKSADNVMAEANETRAAPVEIPIGAGNSARPANAAGATIGGDGSQIVLSALAEKDIADAGLRGELACGFSNAEGQSLLLAKGDVKSGDPANGLVKIAGYPEPLRAPGGFDGMVKGATFTGKGTTIRIAVTGPATGGGESPPSPATLTFDRADGAKRVFTGIWTCGP